MPLSLDERLQNLVTTAAELEQINVNLTAAHLRFLLKHLRSEGLSIASRMLKEAPASLTYSGLNDEQRKTLQQLDASVRHLFVVDVEYLRAHPYAAGHYRCLLGLSKKAAPKTFPMLYNVEKSGKFPKNKIDLLNEEVSRANQALYEAYSSVQFSQQLANLVIASIVGATLDGIWRTEIGFLAEYDIADAICYFGDKSITSITASGTQIPINGGYEEASRIVSSLREKFEHITEIHFANGARFEFPSNPDMRVYGPTGAEVAVGELKGNTDPANVWERWPLVVKTLGEAKHNNPKIVTFFVGEVITSNLAYGEFMESRQAVNAQGVAATRQGVKQCIEDGTVDYAFKKSALKRSAEFREMLATLLEIDSLAMPEPTPKDQSGLVRDEDLGEEGAEGLLSLLK